MTTSGSKLILSPSDGNKLFGEIAESLGVDPDIVRSVKIEHTVGTFPSVTVVTYVPSGAAEKIKRLFADGEVPNG